MNGLTRRAAYSADRERFRYGFGQAVKAFRATLEGEID